MSSKIAPIDRAIPVYFPAGSTVTFTNYDAANDFYVNEDVNELNAALIGVASTFRGTKVAHNGGQVQIPSPANGRMWVRSSGSAAVVFDVE